MATSNKTETASTRAPKPAQHRQQVRKATGSSWVTPKSGPSQLIAVGTTAVTALLYVSRHHVLELTDQPTAWLLFVLLKLASLGLGAILLCARNELQNFYKPPFKGQECFLASLLAVCAFVIYHQGRIDLAFFNYQAEGCFWIGYWFEWWTGIVSALSYVFGCTSRKDKPFTFGEPASRGGMDRDYGTAAATGRDDPPPPYPTESVGGWSLCVARFLVRVGDMIRDI
ncbi:uncharacterized protein PG986_005227 [Apiospora aurea]|uniref:MARVEL domain-containing protein n=1 Tax=Apiospora aurea TaxID=335848 RepID=A0ABR1QH82_9PEZI